MESNDGLHLRIKRINGKIFVQKVVCLKTHRRHKEYGWRSVDGDGHYFPSRSTRGSYLPSTTPKKFKSIKAAKKFVLKLTHPERNKVIEEYIFPWIKS
jgi:hypothetical protein